MHTFIQKSGTFANVCGMQCRKNLVRQEAELFSSPVMEWISLWARSSSTPSLRQWTAAVWCLCLSPSPGTPLRLSHPVGGGGGRRQQQQRWPFSQRFSPVAAALGPSASIVPSGSSSAAAPAARRRSADRLLVLHAYCMTGRVLHRPDGPIWPNQPSARAVTAAGRV